ncbi:hypothetical protein DB88DRAFT_518098 [Papiliotrema laurentii]|uniref:Uncharacterized protein n=1 Tax=Papiliotrema laurentii TaxID=5418 RepID=A0AAD9CTZ8_PAPLA|nr:hypothetical protein DB88DRAFT_518098 [Papiliotrema laurentii]
MNPGFGPEMFPLYEGVDAEYVAGAPDVSYPVEYGYANFGDDLDDDTLSDIYIEDEAYPDEDYYVNDFENEPWLPYNPSKDAGSGGAQQQIVLGGGIPIHPPTGELTESYCRFYPGECSGKVNVLPQVNSTCIAGANGSDPNCMAAEGTDRGLYPALNSVDLSGVGMVLLIALLLLIGVHFGWDSDKGKQAKGPGEERPRQTKRGSPERPSEQGDRQDRPGPGDAPQPRKNDRQEGGPRRLKDRAAAPLPPDRPPADSRKGEGGEGASSLTPTEKEKQKAQAALEKAKKEQKRARESGDAEAIRRADEKVKKAEEKLRRATAADNRARGNGNPGDARQRDDKRDGHERPPRTTPASEETGRRDRTDGSGHPKRSSETPGSDPDPRSRRRERDKGDGQPSGPAQPADTPRSKTRTPSQQAADDAVTAAEKNLKAGG